MRDSSFLSFFSFLFPSSSLSLRNCLLPHLSRQCGLGNVPQDRRVAAQQRHGRACRVLADRPEHERQLCAVHVCVWSGHVMHVCGVWVGAQTKERQSVSRLLARAASTTSRMFVSVGALHSSCSVVSVRLLDRKSVV